MTYYIASLKHTHRHHEHITFLGPDHRGYTPVISDHIGKYDEIDASMLNDGRDHIAVPVELVDGLQSPEPYYKPGARFYDQRGSVVDNTKANWDALIAGSLEADRDYKPKPEIFRGKRRAIFTEVEAA